LLPVPVLGLVVLEVSTDVASHASALKAHRQSVKHREHNRQFRSRLRGALKSIREAIDTNDLGTARSALKQTISLIDKMASKGIIHRNAAGRYKSRLAARISAKSA
jgi:small subunit ribosomal protein S20